MGGHAQGVGKPLSKDIAARMPPELGAVFAAELDRMVPTPSSAVALLDAIDRARCGLGVAIGRGEVGEELRYRRLGELIEWLYKELGEPQDSQYAVAKRAAYRLRAKDPS